MEMSVILIHGMKEGSTYAERSIMGLSAILMGDIDHGANAFSSKDNNWKINSIGLFGR